MKASSPVKHPIFKSQKDRPPRQTPSKLERTRATRKKKNQEDRSKRNLDLLANCLLEESEETSKLLFRSDKNFARGQEKREKGKNRPKRGDLRDGATGPITLSRDR